VFKYLQFGNVNIPSFKLHNTDSRDVTFRIRHFFRNSKSDGYSESDCGRFEIFVLVQLYSCFQNAAEMTLITVH